MALSISEANRLDASKPFERPGKADRRILTAGKENESGFCADKLFHRTNSTQSTLPSGRASAAISVISAGDNEKSKIAIFSESRSTLDVRGMTIAPCWTR